MVLNFSLKLSTVQETITVSGDAPIVQSTSSEVSSTIDQRAFETLPVKERNYFRLLTLDSNVVATGTGSNAVNVGGQEVWNFGTYVDGTNNHSKWLTLQRAPQLGSSGFAIETVKEVQLITNQFSAEFGGHSAGVSSMITKSGTNEFNGSAFVMIRPGDLDAAPPLAPIVNGEKVKAPYNQQQFGATVGGPLMKDKMFFFGSYERRRERSEVAVTAVEAPGRPCETPADEHQGHAKIDLRFSERQSLGVRYNMVRWYKDNEGGGLELPGTGFIWDNNVDTVHGTFTTVISDKMLNEVRGQYSRYTDSRAAKCDCVSIVRQGYSTSGGNDQGTWGVLPEETYDLSSTLSMWSGNHTMKTGASFTYDVTEQLFAPLQNGRYTFSGSPTAAPTPFQFSQAFALTPEARLMFPKAYVLRRVLPGRLARAQQPDPQLRPALRRRGHQGHPRLAGRHGQEQPRPARRFCLGCEGRSKVGGPRRLRRLHPAARHLHHRQGRRRRPQWAGDAVAQRRGIRCSRPSPTSCRASRPERCCRRAASRRSRPIWRTSTRGRPASASSISWARAAAWRSTSTSTAASSTGSST